MIIKAHKLIKGGECKEEPVPEKRLSMRKSREVPVECWALAMFAAIWAADGMDFP